MIPFLAPLLASQRVRALAGPLCLALAVAALCGALWARGEHFKGKAERWEKVAGKYEAASNAAREWAQREKASKEASATAITEQANATRRTSDSRAADYARRNVCLRAESADRERPAVPRPDPAARQPASDAGHAELVGLSADDFARCTAAALDLQNAAQWAERMRAAGLAR